MSQQPLTDDEVQLTLAADPQDEPIDYSEDKPTDSSLFRQLTFQDEAGPVLTAYFFASLATLIKTVAWWFNQWPFTEHWNFFAKWACSAGIAGFEYLPLTFAMQYANKHGVHLSLMTAYMEAADNMFRMFQQLALGDPLGWYDWFAAILLVLWVLFQGTYHYRYERGKVNAHPITNPHPTERVHPLRDMRKLVIYGLIAIAIIIGALTGSLLGGPTGQAYTLAVVATGAKTFAWWINQYPALKNKTFIQKWLAGWSIAAIIEYLPLIGAFTIASEHGVHLGLMTAFMEALDNAFRIAQQYFLGKPLFWFDYVAAAGMFVAVLFQGIMRYMDDAGRL